MSYGTDNNSGVRLGFLSETPMAPKNDANVVRPNTRAEDVDQALANKRPTNDFVTTKDFVSDVKEVYHDPKVVLQRAQHQAKYNKLTLEANKQQEQNLLHKISTAKTYLKTLKDYVALPMEDKSLVSKTLVAAGETLKLIAAKNLIEKDAAKVAEALPVLDNELEHLRALKQLQVEGAKLNGSLQIKTYRSVQPIYRNDSDPTTQKAYPAIKGAAPSLPPYHLHKGIAKPLFGGTDGDGYVEVVSKFKETLPDNTQWLQQLQKSQEPDELQRKIQHVYQQGQRAIWDIEGLRPKLKESHEELKKLQQEIKDYLKDQSLPEDVSSGLSILVDNKPVVFENREGSLFAAVQKCLSNKPGLGDITATSSGVVEAQDLLNRSAETGQQLLTQLENKQEAIKLLETSIVKGDETPATQKVSTAPPTGKIIKLVVLLALLVVAGTWMLKRN